ncbi:MAG: hypothetical protein KDD40_05410, partial [Bdellovibrionales bacterium]|nr:hypothetical protein [Bdellovibrionales bacterium]
LDLRLEWQQDIDQNILTLSVKDLHHINFDYLFSERWSPQPQRQYQMKVSNFEFVTDQTTYNVGPLNTYVYHSSEISVEIKPTDFSDYISFIYFYFSFAIPSFQ